MKVFSYHSPLRNEDLTRNRNILKGSLFEVFLAGIFSLSKCSIMNKTYGPIYEQKQPFSNICTKQEILVALGCKSLYEAAAAHVNNEHRGAF